jgi:hypothetical protein
VTDLIDEYRLYFHVVRGHGKPFFASPRVPFLRDHIIRPSHGPDASESTLPPVRFHVSLQARTFRRPIDWRAADRSSGFILERRATCDNGEPFWGSCS